MESAAERSKVVVGNESALRLLNKMMKNGLFHDTQQNHYLYSYPDNDIDDMNRFINKAKNEFHPDDCNLIFPQAHGSDDEGRNYIMTRKYLSSQIFERVNESGRISLQGISSDMHITIQDVQQSVRELCDMEDSSIHNIGVEVITEKYLDEKCQELRNSIEYRQLIHDVANEWNLPLHFTLEAINKRINMNGFFNGMHLTVDCDGAKQLVTNNHEKNMLSRVEDLLGSVKAPKKMGEVMENIQLDPIRVLNHVKNLCQNKSLKGSLHVDESNSINVSTAFGAVYTPICYEENQEKGIMSFFDTNGYVTLHHGDQAGMSKKWLDECILRHNPRAIALKECLIHPDTIMKAQCLIEDSVEAQSFLNLALHLPEGICRANVETLMSDHVFSSMEELVQSGCLIFLGDGETFFFSTGMINKISKTCFQPLIEEYAKPRAMEIAKSLDSACEELEDELQTKGKKSRNVKARSNTERKCSKKRSTSESDTISYGKVALTSVANAVAEMYPELSDIQANYSVDVAAVGLSWDDDGDDGDDDGPIYSFCRHAFGNSESFEKKCADAVKEELIKIMAEKKGSTTHNRGFGAAKVKNIELSFEESFKTACQWLQVLAKFPQYLLNSDADSNFTEEAKKDFLNGCAADFTRRMTEYCIFKHGVEEVKFHFFSNGEDTDSAGSFYLPVDTTQKEFRKVFLSCQSSKGEEDPLKMLREYFPGSSGVELARAWKFCGGENYAGGEIILEDGGTSYKPGDFDRFLSHTEESCLSICGLPFKLLDKKSEKQLLFARKKELRAQLQDSVSEKDTIELSIMLLFQQLKNTAICGDKITSVAVEVLISDKKLPENVAGQLMRATSLLQCGGEIPTETLNIIKDCGLSRDVTKISESGKEN